MPLRRPWRRSVRGLVAVFAGAAALLAGCGDAPRAPNLILVSIDTLRADHVGAYRYPRGTYTPDPRDLHALERSYSGPIPDSVSVALLQRINDGRQPVTWEDVLHIESTYDAELRSADRAFEELLAFLRESGLDDDTMIVLLSDHGEEFGEHGRVGWHSHTLYDELMLVPSVFRFPGSAHAGRIVDASVRGIDFAPTVVAALGVGVPEDFLGQDLEPLITGRRSENLPAVISRDQSTNPDSVGVRVARWKLYNDALFDLARDPYESVSLSARYPDVVRRLLELHDGLVNERPPAPTVPTDTPVEVVEKLRALGYVD